MGDVTGLVERAARAISDDHDPELWDQTNENWKINKRGEARAAILAALDPEDEAMVEDVKQWLRDQGKPRVLGSEVRDVLAALKALAQGNEGSDEG